MLKRYLYFLIDLKNYSVYLDKVPLGSWNESKFSLKYPKTPIEMIIEYKVKKQCEAYFINLNVFFTEVHSFYFSNLFDKESRFYGFQNFKLPPFLKYSTDFRNFLTRSTNRLKNKCSKFYQDKKDHACYCRKDVEADKMSFKLLFI